MTKALTPIQGFELSLSKMEFAPVLPSHISEDKFKQVVVTAMQKNPNLLSLNRGSLFNACKECAQDGLLPDGREAALVPFGGTVKYMPMVQGITKKARNSGEIATIDALVVYKNDEYDSWVDEHGAHFKHRKCRGKRGDPELTYAYAITKDGSFYFEEIDEDQMKAIEGCSKGSNTPWKGPFRDEMRRKSALRRLCKYRLPSSSDIDGVMRRDDDLYDFDNKEESPVENKETPKEIPKEEPKKSKLEEVVDAEVVELKLEPETAEEGMFIEGIVADVKSKTGETNGKKWTKYGVKLGNNFYGTFSSTVNDLAVGSKNNNIPIKIKYETSEVENITYRNILKAELLEGERKDVGQNNEEKWPEEIEAEQAKSKQVPI